MVIEVGFKGCYIPQMTPIFTSSQVFYLSCLWLSFFSLQKKERKRKCEDSFNNVFFLQVALDLTEEEKQQVRIMEDQESRLVVASCCCSGLFAAALCSLATYTIKSIRKLEKL